MSAAAPAALARTEPDAPTAPAPRLGFLDGMRGLAALFVAVGHVGSQLDWEGRPAWGSADPVDWAWAFVKHGRLAVAAFIVLSGYCLMLPIARSGGLRGGLLGFARRRARRILPPYYAALGLTLALALAFPVLSRPSGTGWDDSLPVWSPRVIAAHLALVHNLRSNWIYAINAPMWSVATESQIYVVFVLALLPCWRRLGGPLTVALAFAAGLAPLAVLPPSFRLDGPRPWYLGLFALGMAAAAWPGRRGAGAAALVAWAGLLAALSVRWPRAPWWAVDALTGLAVAATIVRCAEGGRLADWLSRPVLLWLGAVSYSLYLVHRPVVALVHLGLLGAGKSSGTLLALAAVAVPLSLAAAAVFHRLVEAPSVAWARRARG